MATRMVMRMQFLHRHVYDTVVILEEGKPPTPMVTSVQHAGSMAVSEQAAPVYSAVQEGSGAEAMELGGREGRGSGFLLYQYFNNIDKNYITKISIKTAIKHSI